MKYVKLLIVLSLSLSLFSCEKTNEWVETPWDKEPIPDNGIMYYYEHIYSFSFAGYYYNDSYGGYDIIIAEKLYFVELGSEIVYGGDHRLIIRVPNALLGKTIDLSERGKPVGRDMWYIALQGGLGENIMGWKKMYEDADIYPQFGWDSGMLKMSIDGDELSIVFDVRLAGPPAQHLGAYVKGSWHGVATELPVTPYGRQF